ncbi:kinesin-like protein KIF26A isoform X3 [Rhinoderma darwinii]|uniref:kinesin-like protein KIF26A isoform X3 n=1 Tax=Rhinoderma darwinii TaxID=43563 RepID=UPI003F67B2C6
MACENSSGSNTPDRKNPSLLELGALCLDSEIIFGFTSHLLRRRGKVADRFPGREIPPPRKRLQSADEAVQGCRPPPEGAGAASMSELGLSERPGAGEWCPYCQAKLAELKKQALKLAVPGSIMNAQFSALMFDKLHVPDYLQKSRNEGESRCDVCATHLNQLKQEAVQMIQSINQAGCPDFLDRPQSSVPVATVIPRLSPQNVVTVSTPKELLMIAGQPDSTSIDGGRENLSAEPSSGPNISEQSLEGGSSAVVSPGQSAAASFFIRAAQKLNLSSKRQKYHPPLPHSREYSTYSTNFSGILQLCPPPGPPCLMRAVSKIKDNPGMGKVKVMVRICPSQGSHDTSESMSFLKVDPRKKQITLHDPSTCGPSVSGHRRAVVAAPKMFAFDSVFPQEASQAEVCSGTVAEVIQSVVNGADGCIFCFGHVKLGKTYTMIGKDASTQSLGIIPCAISWLFKLINERREKTGTRFSIRVSAVEIHGKDENLKDLLAEVATGSLQDGQSPGVYLREDPICGSQLQNQSELRAPTAEKAAHFLDAAIAARSTNKVDCDEEDRRNSHMLFTLHIYQYRMEKSGKGGMSGGRSRLHLIDLGSCEKVLSKSRDGGGGGLCLSLNALGNVILALVNGAKHVPYRDSKLTMLLRESLGNINCRTTMIAHISETPSNYPESLATVQLASRIHRMKKKKSKYASSSSGGESSCEEGKARRPHHIRPFHPRTVVLDPDFPAVGIHSDPDYSSSSEQSCDTVIYVGPNGAVLSDQDLTDNEGPPEFVPIIPSLLKRRSKDNLSNLRSSDNHLKCNTFAELQERLECIDGSENPSRFLYEELASSALTTKAMNYLENIPSMPQQDKLPHSPRKGQSSNIPYAFPFNNSGLETTSPQLTHEHPQQHAKAETARSDYVSDGDQLTITERQESPLSSDGKFKEQPNLCMDPSVREKSPLTKRSLPIPAPPPPQTNSQVDLEPCCGVRTPPVGMSKIRNQDKHNLLGSTFPVMNSTPKQPGPVEVRRFCAAVKGKGFDRDIVTTTVTLQKPVELNGEDELVFTVVEELSIGGILDNGRPSSIISFNSDCSLQALASGSRPVSIISSINDEFDAYTSQITTAGVNIDIVVPLSEDQCTIRSRGSSVSSWLSEVSICTIKSDGAETYDTLIPHSSHKGDDIVDCLDLDLDNTNVHVGKNLKNSLNDSGFCFSEMDNDSISSGLMYTSNEKSLKTSELTKALPTAHQATSQPRACGTWGTISVETIHSSLPRKNKSTSSTTHANALTCKGSMFEDPWAVRQENSVEGRTENQTLSVKSSTLVTDNQFKQSSKVAQTSMPKAVKSQTTLGCSQRVVDGCEVDPKPPTKKNEPLTKVPQLRRGATTLGVVTNYSSQTEYGIKGTSDAVFSDGSLKLSGAKKTIPQKASMLPRPGGSGPPAPPVRKSSLDHKNNPLHSNSLGRLEGSDYSRSTLNLEEDSETQLSSRVTKSDHSLPKAGSSLKNKSNKSEYVQRYGSHVSLERCDSLTSVGSRTNVNRDNSTVSNINKTGRTVPRLGNPPASNAITSPPSCSSSTKSNQAKSSLSQKATTTLSKNRSLSSSGSKPLSSSVKSLNQSNVKCSGIPPSGKAGSRSVQSVNGKPARGTIMGTKQALRAANNRVNELASGGTGKIGQFRGSTDSDSGNDSGINLSDEKSQAPVLPSPYSKITAPRRPQRYSSGHGSDNSSVLSGELPPAMGRTALFYHSGSSGYESMIRDSEATGSASSAHDSMSESGMSSSGRLRSLKSPKKRGLQRRRLIPTPLPETATVGRKNNVTGQWVDLPPLPGTLKEPFEIKVYEIDDVERLQRHKREEPELFQDMEKGLMYFNTKLKVAERRQQRIKDVKTKYETLKDELEETKARLMMDPNKWRGEFEVDPDLDRESQEYLEALEQVTEDLELCVNICKSHVMMVTCFDIGMIADQQDGGREVEV